MKAKSERVVAQSCPTPSNPMDYSLPGSSIHGILQARVLEWGAIAFSSPLALAYIFSCSEILPGAIQECRHTNSYNCGWHLKIIKAFLAYSSLRALTETWQGLGERIRSTHCPGNGKALFCSSHLIALHESPVPCLCQDPSTRWSIIPPRVNLKTHFQFFRVYHPL